MKAVVCLLLVVLSFSVVAQKPYAAPYQASLQSLESTNKTSVVADSTTWDNPKKATVLALVLPGAGQIYNKKYWKAAIVYAGLGGLAYMFKYNTDSLDKYQTIYVSKLDTNITDLAPERSSASIKSDRDFHRRYRDISILGFIGVYALQVIDANVDAHLKEFKVNKDLALHLSPDIYARKPGIGRYSGMTVRLTF